MSIAPPPPPRAAFSPGPRPAGAPGGGGGGGGAAGVTPTIDPVRLLKQYKYLLGTAVIAGLMLGTAAFFVCRQYWPEYRATVIYQGLPPVGVVGSADSERTDQQEFERYLMTQARIMVSERVLRDAVREPRLKAEKVGWLNDYLLENGTVDQGEASRELKDVIAARPVTGTNLLELTVSARTPNDAAVLVNTVHDVYWRVLGIENAANTTEIRNVLNKQITELRGNITRLEDQRAKILREYNLETNNTNESAARRDVEIIGPTLVDMSRDLERLRGNLDRMERQLKSETGPVYDEAMREEAERSQLVASVQADISAIKTNRDAKIAGNMGPNHREILQLNALLAAKEQELNDQREKATRMVFESTLERTRQAIDGLNAQTKDLRTKYDAALGRLQEIVKATAEYDNLGRQRDVQADKLQDAIANLDIQQAKVDLQGAERVGRMRVLERGRSPEELAFPRLRIMLAAGVILVLGLTGGGIVLREVLDQRVKGPSDIAMIPRLRLLGLVPLAADDPSKPAAPETAFKDAPSGAMAEAFRQMHPGLLKKLQQGGHRSLLMLGAMPGSGTTTVTANLGMACAAADQRVLLIDANLRRPALHRVFKLGEGPGLGEVLGKKSSLEQAVQNTSVEGLHLLAAGAPAARGIPERLATDGMTALLREATDRYDLVIIDTAPAMVAGDGLALANRCDAVTLVVRALAEKRGLIARVRDQLAESRAEFVGVVVNAVRASAGGYMKRNIRASYEYQNNGG